MPDLLDECLQLHRLLALASEHATNMRLKIEFLEHEIDRLNLIIERMKRDHAK
jgi:hypothetical protein